MGIEKIIEAFNNFSLGKKVISLDDISNKRYIEIDFNNDLLNQLIYELDKLNGKKETLLNYKEFIIRYFWSSDNRKFLLLSSPSSIIILRDDDDLIVFLYITINSLANKIAESFDTLFLLPFSFKGEEGSHWVFESPGNIFIIPVSGQKGVNEIPFDYKIENNKVVVRIDAQTVIKWIEKEIKENYKKELI